MMSRSLRPVVAVIGAFLLADLGSSGEAASDLVAVPELGLRIQRGFRISLFADADLANDIQAMTLDSQGRVVVTGPGYIKTLHDTAGRGRADHFTFFAAPAEGGRGMCFDGPALYFSGNGWFSRYEDLDGDGVADRPPENLLPLDAGEHGGHAVRKGPDGSLFLIGGNAMRLDTRFFNTAGSPVRTPEAGALLQFSPTGGGPQIIAHGFRNPCGFDFDIAGDIFTIDSGAEGDFFLPWYTPTRLFHVAYGGHHGWRLEGGKRGWARPSYYADTVDILASLGRGSPAGLVCYRHTQFPARYRGGLFALDWTHGRILFVALVPAGASYAAQPELFLEPIGTQGFAPTDIAVAPDGSLFVCIGGHRTHGAVFHIEYAGPPLLDKVVIATQSPEINAVLQAPQPFDAWSRARWIPLAKDLGVAPFLRTMAQPLVDSVWRGRAVEVVTEVFGGLPPDVADTVVRTFSTPLVRARVAWSLGRMPGPNPSLVLFPLLADDDPLVRRCALEAVADQIRSMDSPELVRLLLPNLGHTDKRVRQATARAASLLSEPSWQTLSGRVAGADPGTQLTGLMAQMWRRPAAGHPEALAPLAAILGEVRDPVLRLDAVRLIILALGDWNVREPSRELYAGYEAAALPGKEAAPLLARLRSVTRALLPSGTPLLDAEAARLLAMLEDDDPRTARVLLNLITPKSPAPADFHYLVCFSRLRAWPRDLTPKVAEAVLNLDLKPGGPGPRPSQNWPARLTDLVQALLHREPKLAAVLLAHPQFARPEHLAWATQIGPEYQVTAAQRYFAAVRSDPNFPWSGPLLELLALLPEKDARPLLRAQWNNLPLRDDLLLQLAARPEPADGDRLWQGLTSTRLDVLRACVPALLQLPPDPARTNLFIPFALLRGLFEAPKEKELRAQVLRLITAETGQAFDIREPDPPDPPTLAHAAAVETAWQPVFAWLAKAHPPVWRALNRGAEEDPVKWRAFLKSVPWTGGSPERGERIFDARGCILCHGGAKPLGPNLAGAAARRPAEDLFYTILFPDRVVTGPYRPTMFFLRDGSIVTGFVAYESTDCVIVQTAATATQRLFVEDIVKRQPGNFSFMPGRLLDGLQPGELADLYSYLKAIPPR